MFDGLKILYLPVDREKLWTHPLIDPKIPVNAKTGEVLNHPPEANYKGLRFVFHPQRVELRGSLHKYFNDGRHNYNSFGLSDLQLVVGALNKIFGINPFVALLNNLEIGVNLKLEYNPDRFLNNLIMHRGQEFTLQAGQKIRYRECIHTQYYVKIYNKGLQYGLDQNILRFELKFRKMERLNQIGIRTLVDLLIPSNWEKLGAVLIAVFDEILMGHIETDIRFMNLRDAKLFIQGHNPQFWYAIKPQREESDYSRRYKIYERRLIRFKELLKITGADKIKKTVRDLMVKKIQILSNLGGNNNEKERGKSID